MAVTTEGHLDQVSGRPPAAEVRHRAARQRQGPVLREDDGRAGREPSREHLGEPVHALGVQSGRRLVADEHLRG